MSDAVTVTTERRDAARDAIHRAAIDEFSRRGFGGTSMANIADAAGMSRPALYQYFRNKSDIFDSAFVAMFEVQVEQSLAALAAPGTTAERIDGLLQRYDGDLYERTAASPHADEIVKAKSAQVSAKVVAVVEVMWERVAACLAELAPGASDADRAGWVELLSLAPKGFKFDEPSVETFRARLTSLARTVAADIDG